MAGPPNGKRAVPAASLAELGYQPVVVALPAHPLAAAAAAGGHGVALKLQPRNRIRTPQEHRAHLKEEMHMHSERMLESPIELG